MGSARGLRQGHPTTGRAPVKAQRQMPRRAGHTTGRAQRQALTGPYHGHIPGIVPWARPGVKPLTKPERAILPRAGPAVKALTEPERPREPWEQPRARPAVKALTEPERPPGRPWGATTGAARCQGLGAQRARGAEGRRVTLATGASLPGHVVTSLYVLVCKLPATFTYRPCQRSTPAEHPNHQRGSQSWVR